MRLPGFRTDYCVSVVVVLQGRLENGHVNLDNF